MATATHSPDASDPHGMSVLIGTESQRPGTDESFFQHKSEYHYLYVAIDTGARYTIETDDDDWTKLALNAPQIDFPNTTTPADPDADIARIWSEDGGGHPLLRYKSAAGIQFEFLRDHTHVVRNETGAGLSKGDVVYISGGSGVFPQVAKADASNTNKMPADFVLAEDITDTKRGLALRAGDIEEIDTSAFNVDDLLFVSPTTPGSLTATQPTGTDIRQSIGRVIKANSSGILAVNIKFGLDPNRDITWTGRQKFDGKMEKTPEDVRNISTPNDGEMAIHDGSGTNTEGPAWYDGDASAWKSTVDGSTIS